MTTPFITTVPGAPGSSLVYYGYSSLSTLFPPNAAPIITTITVTTSTFTPTASNPNTSPSSSPGVLPPTSPPSGPGAGSNSSSISVSDTNPGASSTSTTSSSSQFTLSQSVSPTATPKPNAPSNNKSSGDLAGGTVAGIAIGAAVFASLVTILISFCVLKSRHPKSHSKIARDGENGNALSSKTMRHSQKESKSTSYEMKSVPFGASPILKLDNHLPPSEDDYTIQNDINGVIEQIAIHVDNYYHSSASTVPKEIRTELESFSSSGSPSLVELFSKASNPQPIIQYCLTRQILDRISSNGDSGSTFLPTEFVALPSTLERLKARGSNKSAMFNEALSRWRVLSAYLYENPTSDRAYLTRRDHRIDDFVNSVSQAFSPWVNSRKDRAQRTRHLTSIIQNATEKGILLFSQPSVFEFDWGQSYDVGKRQLVVSPALMKVTDENAQKLQKPQRMISWSVVNV